MSTPTTPTGANLQLPQSTPVKTGSSTTLPYSSTQKYRIDSCSALAKEVSPYLVGPMPVQDFLDDFFPVDCLPHLDDVPAFNRGCYRRTVRVQNETLAYEPFVSPSDESFCFLTTVVCFQDCDN